MSTNRNKEILLKLLNSQTSEEVEKVITTDPFFEGCKWIFYGDRFNNVSTVEGQMRDADNALMEKIINSIDAILMRRCYEEGIDPRDKTKAPKSVAEAVERFFGGKEKLREKRAEFAKEWLRVTAEGKKDVPTITIIDKGEGQQPNDIKGTILSLHKDIKARIPFVYGTYNQGGSSSLGYAAQKPGSYDFNYPQLVLCRRAAKIQDKTRSKNSDHYGFTIVRRRFDYEASMFTYEYFVESKTEDIFSFPVDDPITVDGYAFTEGCLIKLYDYELPQRGNIVFRGLNEFVEKKLSDAPLPIYLKELRDYKGGTEYTIFGLREKILRRSSILRTGYPQKLPIDLGEIGKREIEVFFLNHKTQLGEKEDISSYLEQPEKIFFIKEGLVLHTENTAWLRNDCGLIDLSPYLFAFIDISNIDPPVAKMLHSGREKFKNNPTTRQVLERLTIFLKNEEFQELDREYARLSFGSEASIKDEAFRKQIMKDIETQPELRDLFELGQDIPLKEKEGEEPVTPYEGTYLPEKFELLGSDPREAEEGSYCRISFDTGADEKLFERREDRGEYDWGKANNFQIAFYSYKRGKITFRVDSNSGIKAPTSEAVIFYLRVPSKNIEFSRAVTVTIKEKEQYVGQFFPSFFEPTKKILQIPIASTRKLHLTTDVGNDYFEREKEPGKLEIALHPALHFSKPKLKDGILEIKVKYEDNEIKKVEDIKLVIQDNANHHFNLVVPVEIVPIESEPQLNLPEPVRITREEWNKDTPAWNEDGIARIPSWTELKKIKINVDSRPFDDLKKITVTDREAARDMLIKHIYIHSIWMFLEFKDIAVTASNNRENKYLDPRDEIFERGIRAASKITVQNIKKLLR